ncbi:unnamed protein product [Chironomus riparius]|uniref:Uncharacterized protein n=1 Tax=Chironomus riparius TaxID=315576 RepID=A0A9N9RWR9_9DIPT|nr:unnamed protein product [Chironomus riparius]
MAWRRSMNGAELVGSQKKKCTRYKNDEEESPPNIVSPESNTVYYPVYNVYRPYMPLVNVMLGY